MQRVEKKGILPQGVGSKSLQIGNQKTRTCNLTATPCCPATRERGTALSTSIFLPTPLPHRYVAPGMGQGVLITCWGQGRLWHVNTGRYFSAEGLRAFH